MKLNILTNYPTCGYSRVHTANMLMFRGNDVTGLRNMVDKLLSDELLSKDRVYTDSEVLARKYNIKLAEFSEIRKVDFEILYIQTNFSKTSIDFVLLKMNDNITLVIVDESNQHDIHTLAIEYIVDTDCIWTQYGEGKYNNFVLWENDKEKQRYLS